MCPEVKPGTGLQWGAAPRPGKGLGLGSGFKFGKLPSVVGYLEKAFQPLNALPDQKLGSFLS